MNKIISGTDFREVLKNGISGAYLFFGEEEYMKKYYLDETRKSVLGTADDAVFRHKKISCLDFDLEEMTDAVTTSSSFGLLASEGKTLCELHELQFDMLKESEWKALLDILSEVPEETVLIIYATPDELDPGIIPKSPSKNLKRLSEFLTPVYFERETEPKLAKWVSKHFISEKLSFENGVCEAIVKRSGRDMFVLSNEIAKLCAFVKSEGRTTVTVNDVYYICCGNMEINAFDFSNAILNADTDRAYAILNDMKLKKEKPVYILSSVTKVISDMYTVKVLSEGGLNDAEIAKELKIHEFRVSLCKRTPRSQQRLKKLLMFCCEADEKLKSTSLDDYTLLDRLIVLSTAR